MKTNIPKEKAIALLTNVFKHDDMATAISKLAGNVIHNNYPLLWDYIEPIFGFDPDKLEFPASNHYLDLFFTVSRLDSHAKERAKVYYGYMEDFVKSRIENIKTTKS